MEKNTTVIQKAVAINRDRSKYGSFAEIGAGQEVARWFFHVGGAAGTVAKSISAYDMKFSDAIYGASERYVSRQRLLSMIDHEYSLLIDRLNETMGKSTTFFAFANTIAATSYKFNKVGEGWMGIRFQANPQDPPNDIIIHVRLLDEDNQKQQNIIGVLGVNLIYGAMFFHSDPFQLISILKEGIEQENYEVDMINFSGSVYQSIDNRIMNLELVKQRLTNAIILKSNGQVIQASELLYKKAVIIERGIFRPVTNATIDLLQSSLDQYCKDLSTAKEDVILLMEISTRSFGVNGDFDQEEFLARVDMLQTLEKTVLVSNHSRDFRLASYLSNYTDKMIAFAMGIPHLRSIFNEDLYDDLDGGILESFGRLFKKNVKLYIYPIRDKETGIIQNLSNFNVEKKLQGLLYFLLENKNIEEIENFKPKDDYISSQEIIEKIQNGDTSWESLVPIPISQLIKNKGYFNSPKTIDKAFSSLFI